MKNRNKYPTEEVEPDDFLDNDEIKRLLEAKDTYKFKQEDELKLLNCVHCNECGTSEERVQLNQKFLEDGNKIRNLDKMVENFVNYQTPYPTDKMRIRKPEGIQEESKTLFFMGCLSTIRIPRFTEHALKYLLSQKIDFTILDKEVCCGYPLYVSGEKKEYEKLKEMNVNLFKSKGYERIICLCPACYHVFRADYPDIGIKFDYISDYLKPSIEKKSGKVSIQHLCQLKNRGRPEVSKIIDGILTKSGYEVEDVPHWCCGGGLGYMHRTDVIDKIANIRMGDFTGDYYTTYCPSCYWVLKTFGKKLKISPKFVDIFNLLL